MASKKESSFKNMVLTLFVVTLVAAGTLGAVYELTKAPIDTANLNKKLNAIKEVVPPFTNNPDAEKYKVATELGDSVTIYPAKNDEGKIVGVAVETFTKNGFSGLIKIMVGFEPDGKIYNYQVLDHKETPGLGSKMGTWFKPSEQADGEQSRNKFFDWLFGIKSESGGKANVVIGKNPGEMKFTVSKDGGDVDAITAATITSRAFCDAIQRGYNAYINNKQGGSNE